MKSDNAIRNGTSIFVGIIVAIAAFVRGALLLPLLLVACSVWGLYVLQHLRGSLPAVPKKKAKAPRRAKFVVPDIEDALACVDSCAPRARQRLVEFDSQSSRWATENGHCKAGGICCQLIGSSDGAVWGQPRILLGIVQLGAYE